MREAPPEPGRDDRQRQRAAWLLPAGALHALLFLFSYAVLTSTPGPAAPDEEVVAFYGSPGRNRLILVGLYVMPFAGITFLWFASALRACIPRETRLEHEFASGLHVVSAILYVALFFAAAAASSVLAVGVQLSKSPLDPMLARQFPQYGQTLMLVFAMRMAAMFVLTSSGLARRGGLLPRWAELAGMAAGVFLLLNVKFDRTLALVFPIWLVFLCAVIRVRGGRARQAPSVET